MDWALAGWATGARGAQSEGLSWALAGVMLNGATVVRWVQLRERVFQVGTWPGHAKGDARDWKRG